MIVLERIFVNVRGESSTYSRRIRTGSLSFYSQGGMWRWTGDLGNGVLLERVRSEGDPKVMGSLFHVNTIEEGDSWLAAIRMVSGRQRGDRRRAGY